MKQLFRELKRRNVYKVAVTYAAVTFVTLQAARLVFPATTLEGLYDELVVLAFVGFPIALVIAWAFELTPEGVRRTPDAEPSGGGTEAAGERRSPTRLALQGLVGLGLLAAAVAGGWYLVGGGGEPPSTAGAAADSVRAEQRSIAVLPFENMGGKESEQFTQGVHDGLLTRLSNISDLQVISRTSVTQYEDTDKTIPQIGEELGARWVVEGAVQQAGGRVQVNAQLIQASEDAHQWAETYRRELSPENLFTIQSELTKKIARSLKAELTADEAGRIERRPTEDLDAYQLYVQGRGFLDQRTGSGIRRAIDYFERALARDSSYAMAWAALAEARVQLGGYGPAPIDSVLPHAFRAARRALALDPTLAEAHASAGLLHMYRQRGPAALGELRRALELKPGLAQAHRWIGVLLDVLGQPGALDHLRRAVTLNPMTPEAHADLAGGLLVRDHFEEALEQARRGKEIERGYRLSHHLEVMALYHLGRVEEALAVHRRAPPIRWSPSFHQGAGALLRLAAGDTARARTMLRQLEEEGSPFVAAWVHAALGESDAAFRALREEENWAWGEPIFLRHGKPEPLGRLRHDPRYRDVIRAANRAWGLHPDGSLPDSVEGFLEAQAED